ncbi:MAG: leucine-rich repeat domain-containing protein [Clostridia bacterium]|nr:leucine-rich repeat domain-containing protein [Clostridia bacterium]
MKKRIYLVLAMIALLACAFAISVNATTVYVDEDGNQLFSYEVDDSQIITSYTGYFPKEDSQGNALTWYVTATNTENGSTVKTVASVLTLDENYATLNNGTYSYKAGTVSTKTVVSVNFPSDMGITTLNLNNGGYKNNNGWDPSGTEILFVYLPSTLTTLPERIIQGSKTLVCEMPSEMPIKEISRVAFYEAKCLREINIPSSVTVIHGTSKNDGAAFYACDSLERVTFGDNSQLEVIEKMAFNLCGSLKYAKIPDGVKRIGEHAFSYTDLRESPFGLGSLCEEMGGRCFGNIPNLESFIVPATLKKVQILGSNDWGPIAETNVKLVTFGNSAPITELAPSFFGRAIIEKIILPNGPTNIPNRYFINATLKDICFSDTIETADERVFQAAYVEVIRLGANFKHFTNTIDDNHSFTNIVKGLKEIYLPASFYAENVDVEYHVGYAFTLDGADTVNTKFFYTGDAAQLATAIENFKNDTKASNTNNWKFTGATQISYIDYISDTEKYSTGNYIIYGYNPCEAFCEPFYTNDMDFNTTIAYESYLEYGKKAVVCPVCKTLGDGVEVAPLFTCLGYSASESGMCGIVIGFTQNNEAILEYKNVIGKFFKYGAFAASRNALADKDIFGKDGTAEKGVINVEFTNYRFDAFELKIVGFTDAQKDIKFAMGAYVVVTDGETVEYSYLQSDEPNGNEKYCYVSYNDIAGSSSKDKARAQING